MSRSGFTGANFSGFQGMSLRFQVLDDDTDRPAGKTRVGRVDRVFRCGRQVFVAMHVPSLGGIQVYEARRLYYRGAAAGSGNG